MGLRKKFILFTSAILAGCAPQHDPRVLKWAKAPGGGEVAFPESITGNARYAIRCFPADAEGRCLIAFEFDGTTTIFQVVSRKVVERLGATTGIDGFSCMHNLGMFTSESVVKGGQTLTTATKPVLGRTVLPSAAHTEEYIRLNVPGAEAQYFDCETVADVFGRGSLATAGTTSITPEMLD